MEGMKILVTGPTSSVGLPVSIALAERNDVTGIARFGNAAAREQLEGAGVRCVTVDFATADFSEVEDEYDYVCNFAIARGGDADWDRDLAANGESVGDQDPIRVLAGLVQQLAAEVARGGGNSPDHGPTAPLDGAPED